MDEPRKSRESTMRKLLQFRKFVRFASGMQIIAVFVYHSSFKEPTP